MIEFGKCIIFCEGQSDDSLHGISFRKLQTGNVSCSVASSGVETTVTRLVNGLIQITRRTRGRMGGLTETSQPAHVSDRRKGGLIFRIPDGFFQCGYGQ